MSLHTKVLKVLSPRSQLRTVDAWVHLALQQPERFPDGICRPVAESSSCLLHALREYNFPVSRQRSLSVLSCCSSKFKWSDYIFSSLTAVSRSNSSASTDIFN
ncbi:hypothetical protein MPTK1_4g09030 [Marchantia polymorpha subsp. ruderalis]|uniref:Uncharacterized protein n=2 Tax=Marchantia polymorpha TaxID=3197 RepID=A0AAF6B7Y4_MARPO|nr:hypothetical protein MARPO_0112s0005 [Marchantia polymorpha]BBN08118.1 hypothetical protein Mp_4g09030 [Marchantia polymorpha subsp. ruderalis]|eukprot:PTQ31344.1 hypothetical protein MARPO_0112s0005 [Marchantia polymorpha]